MSTYDTIRCSALFYFSKRRHTLRECRNHPDEISMFPWKQGLVALQAAETELLVVGGLARWLCFGPQMAEEVTSACSGIACVSCEDCVRRAPQGWPSSLRRCNFSFPRGFQSVLCSNLWPYLRLSVVTIIIRCDLGYHRTVSVSSSSLFKRLLSRLCPFGLQDFWYPVIDDSSYVSQPL